MFINSVGAEDRIPWDAMLYMTGHINYGGRVTDDWDRRCLISILKKYYNPAILEKEKYELSSSKIYFVPPYGAHKTYMDYISSLPNFEDPEVFGMHENANITYQTQESNKIMETVLSIQPRISAAASGKTPD
jgi:dynein heavy chain